MDNEDSAPRLAPRDAPWLAGVLFQRRRQRKRGQRRSGTGKVCYAGACTNCASGAACTPTTACKHGATDCSTGQAVCNATTNLSNGTSCGTNMVCNNGSCQSCAEGGSCTPTVKCKNGAYSCSTGTAVCNPTSNLSNGSSCGTNQVCYNGSCNACQSGASCTSSNECMNATTQCGSGQPVCSNTTPKSNGSSCTASGCNGFDFGCTGSGSCSAGDAWDFSSAGGFCVATVYYCPGTPAPSPLSGGYSQLSNPAGCDYSGCPDPDFCQRNFCVACPGNNCNNCPTWPSPVFN